MGQAEEDAPVVGPVELEMPFGMGLNNYNVIVEMDASGTAVQDGTLILGDQITHVDGIALSDKVTFVQALDRSLQTHLIRAIRLGVVDGGEWLWIARSALLPLPMGLGLDEDNRITEVKPGGNAAREGTIRVVRRPDIQPSPKRRHSRSDAHQISAHFGLTTSACACACAVAAAGRRGMRGGRQRRAHGEPAVSGGTGQGAPPPSLGTAAAVSLRSQLPSIQHARALLTSLCHPA